MPDGGRGDAHRFERVERPGSPADDILSKLFEARSRLYRRRFIIEKAVLRAFFEISKIYTPPLGVKKRQSLFLPKRIFWQEQISLCSK